MGSAPASLADNPFLITLLLEMQTTIFLRTEMSRKTEYVHNPCFLSANILKILGVFAENQIDFSKHSMAKELKPQKITDTPIKDWALKLVKNTNTPTKKENCDVLGNKNSSNVKTLEKDISEMPPIIRQSNICVEDKKSETPVIKESDTQSNIAKKKWW